jgi:lantibiotic modifying enzyme
MASPRKKRCPNRSNVTVAHQVAKPVAALINSKFYAKHHRQIRRELSSEAWTALEESLIARLAFTGRFAAEWVWQVYRTTQGLFGTAHSDAREITKSFFAVGVERRAQELLRTYPALSRLWAVQSRLWFQASAKFLKNLGRLIEEIGGGSSPRLKAARIQTDLSDLHNGNQTVAYVLLSDESDWYYKPRQGEAEAIWSALLLRIGTLAGLQFKRPTMRFGENCFWMEAICHKPCRDRAEAAAFFYKAGLVLYLAYRLRAVDFHAGNLIAHGSDPVLVDCETLLHPRDDGCLENVCATGFFPIGQVPNGADSVSALGRLSWGTQAVGNKDQSMFAADFADDLVAGFQLLASTRSLHREAEWALREAASELKSTRGRRLRRSTAEYYEFLDHSLAVDVLENGEARWHRLHDLCKRAGDRRVAVAEAKALEQVDIPFFYGVRSNLRPMTSEQMEEQSAFLRSACRSLKKRSEESNRRSKCQP